MKKSVKKKKEIINQLFERENIFIILFCIKILRVIKLKSKKYVFDSFRVFKHHQKETKRANE
jgi:hypothetical protein